MSYSREKRDGVHRLKSGILKSEFSLPQLPQGRSYNGESPELTSKKLEKLLQSYLTKVSDRCALRPDLVLATWPKVVGPQIASMTKAMRFDQSILYVSVKNSTLLSILSQGQDKARVMRQMSLSLPGVEIRDILFRFG